MLTAYRSSSSTANHEELMVQVPQNMLPTDLIIHCNKRTSILWMPAHKISTPIYIYRVSQEKWTKLWESVPCV